MLDKGYILVHRKLKDNVLWKEKRVFSKAEAWLDILMEVQWQDEEREHMLGLKQITTKRGQCIYSLETWGKRWRWDKYKVRRFMLLLQSMNMICYESVVKSLRITVLNYDTYQTACNPGATDAQRTRNQLKKGKEREEGKRKKTISVEAYGIAESLKELVKSKKNINVDGGKLRAWAEHVRKACECDGIAYDRQQAVMKWYEQNQDAPYLPIAESGKSWRDKFLRIEGAMERSNGGSGDSSELFKGLFA